MRENDLPVDANGNLAIRTIFDPEAFLASIDNQLGALTADSDEVTDVFVTISDIVDEKANSGELFPPDHEEAKKILARHQGLLGL